ncbi:hypothetical protein CIB84_011073, partial [Bambusicola thoracicus]
ETVAAACILTVIIYAVKKYGADVAAFADKLNEEKIAKALEVKNEAIKALETAIEEEKKEQWRIEGRSYLFDAKRNNIAMLLEANYRERLLTVYNEVKKRLDYQVALQNLKRQKEQDHMVQWVEKNVIQSITPQQSIRDPEKIYKSKFPPRQHVSNLLKTPRMRFLTPLWSSSPDRKQHLYDSGTLT